MGCHVTTHDVVIVRYSGFLRRHSVSSRSVQDSAARSSGPYLAALPLLPRLGAPVGTGGAGSSRDGALGVVGVEACFGGDWFHLCYSWLGSAPESSYAREGPYLSHLSSFVSVLPLGYLL